jgi:ABC superfamily ATP binding cassette transporter, ABC protein
MKQIRIERLMKKYRQVIIFQDIDLVIDNQKYNFLVGGNGTGKSTFIHCLLGEVKYDGKIDIGESSIAYVPERMHLPDYISVSNFLVLLARLDHNHISSIYDKVKYYLKLFSLEIYEHKPICKLSQGNRQKVILIQALMKDSDIYIFDEPLTGLDIHSQKVFLDELRKKKNQDKLIIVSTHRIENYKYRNKNIIQFPLEGRPND